MDYLIWEKNNSLSINFCNHLIEKFEKDDKKVLGRVDNSKLNTNIKKSTDLHISSYPDWKNEDDVLFSVLLNEWKNYLNHIEQNVPEILNFFNYDDIIDSGYQIQRTYPSEYYNWHHDSDVFLSTKNQEYYQRCGVRLATYIWYLNTIDYDGETEFSGGYKIKPEAGKIIFFPATITYVHRGISPKSQTKYICTGWMSTRS